MSWKYYCKAIIIIGASIDALIYLYKRYRVYIEDKRQKILQNEAENKVFFFPDESLALCNAPSSAKDMEKQNIKKEGPAYELSSIIKSAKESLDVCVFVITSTVLTNDVIWCAKKGIAVRVITDEEQAQDCFGSQMARLRAAGIPVRVRKGTAFLMHHKFAIIDQRILVNGSFNWTRNAISGNNENLMVTNYSQIVKPYIKQFEKLWSNFDPDK